MLLKICIKSEHFSIIFKPWRLHSRNIIIFRFLPVLKEGQLSEAFCHFVNEVSINLLFHKLSFLLVAPIYTIELLSLMEVLLIRITKNMTRQKRNLLWNVSLHINLDFISYILLIYINWLKSILILFSINFKSYILDSDDKLINLCPEYELFGFE